MAHGKCLAWCLAPSKCSERVEAWSSPLPSLRGSGQLAKEDDQSGQGEAYLGGGWGQEGDQENPLLSQWQPGRGQ